ncbi:hypothetical protein SLEP1_g35169 [Rubroshorea leprosula]|uniref:Reverse transcriptase Ty1/copia-type domain-containing protein n=1 Tax=Rubroshorea leprosula TaxID=152421 RepID=A0AAV5KMM9_9ROSI|nr:hypothetical protein SLEP1_g35169 [Rubroshorea leprosula]
MSSNNSSTLSNLAIRWVSSSLLPNNPTVAQMKQHAEYVQASYKALSYIHSAVTDDIFSRIMGAETAQEAWDTLKKEFDGSSRVKDKFESKISTIEESCDLKELTITELRSKLQAHEQRLAMKTDETTKRAFLARQKGKQPTTSSESNKTMGSNQAYQQHQQSRKRSGCTNHMAQDESLFIEMDKSVIANVKLGNGTVVRSQGKGTVVIQTKTGYATQAKGYKVYDPISKKVNVHKDVVFDESAHWNWDAGKIENGSNKQCEAGSKLKSTDVACSSEIVEVDDDSLVLKTKSLAEIYARCNLAYAEPNCFEEASKQQVWIDAMKEELSMIEKNETWCLVPKPDDKKPIGVKWVARHDTIRPLIALVANLGWKLFHMDVKSAFLNGVLQEEIYVEQLPRFEITRKEDCVYKLNKALYGLKQVPRAWYSRIDDYLMCPGFKKSTEEATLYVKSNSSESQLILSLYVDDLLLTGNDLKSLEQFKKVMMQEFAMTDLGETKNFLGLEVQQLSKGIFICQRKYALDILKKFEMENCKPVATPLVHYEKLSKDDQETKVDSFYYRNLIGSLLYLTATRPDLMFAASYLSSNQQGRLQGYADSDWAGSMEDMISTTSYVFSFGSGSFSWNSKKQDVVAQSTTEAKYLAAKAAANHAIWLRMVLEELGFDQIEPCVLKFSAVKVYGF